MRDNERRYRSAEWLRDRYVRQGKSQGEIADICDCDQSTVHDWLKRHGIPRRDKHADVDERLDNRKWLHGQYIKERKNTREISDICCCSPSTVARRLQTHGIPTRDGGPSVDRRLDDVQWLRQKIMQDSLSASEIADICDCSPDTVYERLSRYDIDFDSIHDVDKRVNDFQWLRKKYADEKKTTTEIADMCDCAQCTVEGRLRKHNIPIRESKYRIDSRLDDEQWLRKKYLKEGKSGADIAEICDCAPATARERLRSNSIQTRSSGAPPGKDHWKWDGGSVRYGNGWNKTKRERVRELDGHECVNCGLCKEKHQKQYDSNLHVHHLIKARSFDDDKKRNAVNNLVTLCASCHRKWEQMSKMRIKPQIDRDRLPTTV
jgi:DNA-binding CsgD family transcriptional regulator